MECTSALLFCFFISVPNLYQYEPKHVNITYDAYNANLDDNETFPCWVTTDHNDFVEHDFWTVHISLNALFLRIIPTVLIISLNVVMMVKIHRIFKARQQRFLKRESMPAIATIDTASINHLFPKTFDHYKQRKSMDPNEIIHKVIKKW